MLVRIINSIETKQLLFSLPAFYFHSVLWTHYFFCSTWIKAEGGPK